MFARLIKTIHNINHFHICIITQLVKWKLLEIDFRGVWDWNYICFNVRGNAAMGYEMHNGELQMYWG